MDAVIYHNSRCSKSRATLELLKKNKIEPTIIHYLETPPSRAELSHILVLLEKYPPQLIRFGESIAKELGLTPGDERTDDQWLDLMVANPILIERPIVVIGDQAVVGRPPENVLTLIGTSH